MSDFQSHAILQKKGLVNLYTMLQNIAAKDQLKGKFAVSEGKVYEFMLPKQFQVFDCGAQVEGPNYTFKGDNILDGNITIRLHEDLKKKHILKVIEFPDWPTRENYIMTGNLPASAVSLDMHLSQDSIVIDKKNTAPVLSQNLMISGHSIGSRFLAYKSAKTKDGEAVTYMKLQITAPVINGISEPVGNVLTFKDNDKGDDIKSIDVMIFDTKGTQNPAFGYKRTYITTPVQTELYKFKIGFKLPDILGGKDVTVFEGKERDVPLNKPLPLKHYVFSKTQWPHVALNYKHGDHSQKGIVPVSPMRLFVRDYNGGSLIIDVDLQFKK